MSRADAWLAMDSPDPEILVVGVPWVADSRANLAPGAVRKRLHRFSTSADEWGVDLAEIRVRDEGNWAVSELDEPAMAAMVRSLAGNLPTGPLRLYLGGDAAINSALGDDTSHVSVDLAVLDRVYAPGAPEARPGGLHISPLADEVRKSASQPSINSFAFVGVDPGLDRDGLTLDAMAYLLLSAVAGYKERT